MTINLCSLSLFIKCLFFFEKYRKFGPYIYALEIMPILILFAILGAMISIGVFLLALVLSMFFGMFTFPFVIGR